MLAGPIGDGSVTCASITAGQPLYQVYDQPTTQPGTFAALIAAGSNAFCGITGSFSPQPGLLVCFGAGSSRLSNGSSLRGADYRLIGNQPPSSLGRLSAISSSSYLDPAVLYGLATGTGTPALVSVDAGYDGSATQDTRMYDARSATAPDAFLAAVVGQPGFTHGISGRSQMSCHVTCGLKLSCFGTDARNPLMQPPPELMQPCSIRVPVDADAPIGTVRAYACQTTAPPSLPFLGRVGETCNLRGLWNDGTLFIDQQGRSVDLYPLSPQFNGVPYPTFLLTDDGSVSADGAFAVRSRNTVGASSTMVKASGAVSRNCSIIRMTTGQTWATTARCAVRFVRVYKPSNGTATPLSLSNIAVESDIGAALSSAALLSASSTSCDGGLTPSDCLAAAVDEQLSTAFTSGAGSVEGSTPLGEWLQLDLGRDIYIGSIHLSGVDLSDVRVVGYDERLAHIMAPQSPPEVPSGITAADLPPAFTYRVMPSSDGPVTSYRFESVAQTCGFDPRSSASATPTRSVEPSRSSTRSITSSRTATASITRSGSPTASLTPSSSQTTSITGSISATPSITGSNTRSASTTATPSNTPSQLAARVANAAPVLDVTAAMDLGEAATLQAAAAATNVAYDWRLDTSLVSLAGAPEIDFQISRSSLAFAWEPFEEVGSGIASIGYCLGSAPFRCDFLPWTPAPSVKAHVDFATIGGLDIPAGTLVFASVSAVNHVGLVSMASSDGVLVDDRAPVIARVVDTGSQFVSPLGNDTSDLTALAVKVPPVDISCDVEGAGVGAVWDDVTVYAGVRFYEWAVGTAPNGTEFLDWTNVGTSLFVYNSSVQVPAGANYVVTVRAQGATGAVSYASSDGVRVISADDGNARYVCVRNAPTVPLAAFDGSN